jgi:hypothetical protein
MSHIGPKMEEVSNRPLPHSIDLCLGIIYNPSMILPQKGGIFYASVWMRRIDFNPAPYVVREHINNREGVTEKEISNKRTAISERRKESRHVLVSRSLCTVRRVFTVCRHVGRFWWMVYGLKLTGFSLGIIHHYVFALHPASLQQPCPLG